jgi:DNA processing protein
MGLLAEDHGPIGALDRVLSGDIPENLSAITAVRRATAGDPITRAREAMERTERIGGRVVIPEDDEWPVQVEDLRRINPNAYRRIERDVYPPLCLWLRGPVRLDDAATRSVAVVGSRASSPYGNHVATELGYGLGERSWTVVSGGAFGIDAQAHRGAMTGGGVTVAVLACGVDRPYPVAHANLFDRIADVGLLLSEWPPGAAPHRHRFLIRNRLIAAMTRGTVVVEASARSGAKQTANRAMLLGRRLMAVPGPVTSAMSVGTHQILRGFGSRLVTNASEVIEEVGRIGDDLATVARGPDRDLDRLDPDIARVLDGVPVRDPAGPAQIASASGVGIREAMRALPLLQAHGFVTETAGRWQLTPRRRDRPPAVPGGE